MEPDAEYVAESGLVTRTEIGVGGDGDAPRRLLQVEISSAEDVQEVEMACAPGEDTCPVKDSTVYILDLGNSWRIAVAGDDGIDPRVAEGEKEIYSIDPITKLKKTSIWLKNDGSLAVSNDLGGFELKANGQVDINNGNLTVDP